MFFHKTFLVVQGLLAYITFSDAYPVHGYSDDSKNKDIWAVVIVLGGFFGFFILISLCSYCLCHKCIRLANYDETSNRTTETSLNDFEQITGCVDSTLPRYSEEITGYVDRTLPRYSEEIETHGGPAPPPIYIWNSGVPPPDYTVS
jgi:hypothetical protein